MKIVKFIVCLLFGLMFINAGLNKFFNYMPMPDMSEEQLKVMEAFMKIVWLLPLAGIIEIIGGILFIIPKYRALGAIVILPVMVGIVLHNILMEPSGIEMALVLFAINLWIILDNWKKYQPLMS
ncbi:MULTISPECIES: DoxX family membrane protein [Flavobacterium]|uniref:DoxX family membrane protein n=1 Tax=Flavobacterium TaxID=237 RepID=UPI0009592145|nr:MULTISPECIES: DoxX family membrane protein [Flavobacterium]MBN9283702.1 DoxX family membrane protein [Flavobacterium sp.]OJV68789.1 MAG: DoxX family protein [Flavobacterium sp. 40-81]